MKKELIDKLDSAFESLQKDVDFTILGEMKAALNSVYGEERNQIVKPNHESILERVNGWNVGAKTAFYKSLEERNGEDLEAYLLAVFRENLVYKILIHFPEIIIKNNFMEHIIRDIYVALEVRRDGTINPHIKGMRTTVTEAEFLSSYLHSHLHPLDPNNIIFKGFCTGVGEINQVTALLNSKYTSANFLMLLMHIKNFLEWESKEGNPYMYMENIFMRSNRLDHYNSLPDWMAESAATTLIGIIGDTLSTEQIMSYFNFSVNERCITVATATSEAEIWMASIMKGWNMVEKFSTTSYYTSILLSLKDSTGKYFNMVDSEDRLNSYKKGTILKFKGQDIEFQIIERKEKTNEDIFANPKITKEVCKKLSSILSKAALSSAGIKSGSSLVYNTGNPEPDKLSV